MGLERLTALYQFGVPKILGIAGLAYLCAGLAAPQRRRNALLFINTALLGAFAADVAAVSYVDATAFPAIYAEYLCATYVIMTLWICLAIYDVVPIVRTIAGRVWAQARREQPGVQRVA